VGSKFPEEAFANKREIDLKQHLSLLGYKKFGKLDILHSIGFGNYITESQYFFSSLGLAPIKLSFIFGISSVMLSFTVYFFSIYHAY